MMSAAISDMVSLSVERERSRSTFPAPARKEKLQWPCENSYKAGEKRSTRYS